MVFTTRLRSRLRLPSMTVADHDGRYQHEPERQHADADDPAERPATGRLFGGENRATGGGRARGAARRVAKSPGSIVMDLPAPSSSLPGRPGRHRGRRR